jgi:hypothetical protein
MEWQTILVVVVVAAAAIYVMRRFWRVWTGKSTGACHCSAENCAKSTTSPTTPVSPHRRP